MNTKIYRTIRTFNNQQLTEKEANINVFLIVILQNKETGEFYITESDFQNAA